jgi:ABC-type transport system involved in cytochrome c biogenesis permease subunit
VQRGKDSGIFGRHLPAGILSQVAYAAVFTIADTELADGNLDATAAATTSLLILGVPETRARALI